MASACIRTPPDVVREALVMTWNGLEILGIQITGTDINISLSLTNASSCFLVQRNCTPFLVRS